MAVFRIIALIRLFVAATALVPPLPHPISIDTEASIANDGGLNLFNQDRILLPSLDVLIAENYTYKMTSSNFRIVTEFETDYSPSHITKYESSFTGMTAVVVNRKGPKVNGFFALATEIHDNSGAPHTLEHLCFMGSEHYPYKGILDRLATRYCSGDIDSWGFN